MGEMGTSGADNRSKVSARLLAEKIDTIRVCVFVLETLLLTKTYTSVHLCRSSHTPIAAAMCMQSFAQLPEGL